MKADEEFEHAIACIRAEHSAYADMIERELRYAKSFASKVIVDYDDGPCAIGFELTDGTYWWLVGDGCWDADDPRSDLLLAALDENARLVEEQSKPMKLALAERDAAIADRDRLKAEVDARRLSESEVEALEFARKVVGASESIFSDRMSDPKVAAHVERCRAALAALDKLIKPAKEAPMRAAGETPEPSG